MNLAAPNMTTPKAKPGRPRLRHPRGSIYKPRTILLDDTLLSQLDGQAEEEGFPSRSHLIRHALTIYLKRAAKRSTRTSDRSDSDS